MRENEPNRGRYILIRSIIYTVRISFDHDPGDSEANNQAKGKKLAVSVQRES